MPASVRRSISERLTLVIVLIGSLIGFSISGPPIQAQDGFTVQGITFKSNKTFRSATLKNLMETKAVGWLPRLVGKKGSEYNGEVITQDIENIATFYQREGFLYVKIDPPLLDVREQSKAVTLTVVIDEGQPITVGRITTKVSSDSPLSDSAFNQIFVHTERVRALREQSRFRDTLVTLDQLLLTRELNNVGYPYAAITPELTVSKASCTVEVTWHITSGPKCTQGDIRFLAVSKVPSSVITRQLEFQTGDMFQLQKIEQSRQQVYGLGSFQVVTIMPDLSNDRNTKIPIEVYLKDAKRFSTRLGIGYGTEDKFRVTSDTRLLGFFGGARQLQLFFKHSDLEPYHVITTLIQPGYPTPRTTLAASPFIWRQREPSFTVNRAGGSIGAIHQFNKTLGGSITYSLEHVRVAKSVLLQTADSLALSKLYNKSQLIFGCSFDNSLPLFNPHRGFYSSNTFTISGLGFGTRTRYTKLLIDVRRYQPLSALLIATRFKLGGIQMFGSQSFVPVEERFYSGGSSSVRGWTRFDLGPHAAGLPIGGFSLLEGSLEIRCPISSGLSGVVFGDLGNAWAESYHYRFSELRYAAGVGIRLGTSIGPIRLDIARPVADVDKKLQVYISVGQAF